MNRQLKFLDQIRPYLGFIVTFCIVTIEVFLVGLLITSRWEKIAFLRQGISDTNARVSEKQKVIATLSNIDANAVSASLTKANIILPSQKKTSGVIAGLSTLASSSGVVVKTLELSPGRISTISGESNSRTFIEKFKNVGVAAVPATVSLTSDIVALANFIHQVEKASQILGITSVDSGAAVGKGISVSLSILVYFQPPRESSNIWQDVRAPNPDEAKILGEFEARDIFSLPGEQP